MSDTTSATPVSSVPRLTGRVKWFNNRSGFGFVTVVGGESDGQDIFVHYTSLSVKSEQYMYLVQGEYVNFDLGRMPEGEKHEHQALAVTGVNGGALMCETRRENPRPKRRYTQRRSSPTPREERRRNNNNNNDEPREDRRRNDDYRDNRRRDDRPRDDRPRNNRPQRRDDRDDDEEYRYVTRRTNPNRR